MLILPRHQKTRSNLPRLHQERRWKKKGGGSHLSATGGLGLCRSHYVMLDIKGTTVEYNRQILCLSHVGEIELSLRYSYDDVSCCRCCCCSGVGQGDGSGRSCGGLDIQIFTYSLLKTTKGHGISWHFAALCCFKKNIRLGHKGLPLFPTQGRR
jgi:hypothetical protein